MRVSKSTTTTRLFGASQPRRANTTKIKLPVFPANSLRSRSSARSLRATWLGHACYYVGDRCMPVQWVGHKRFTRPPCSLGNLPFVNAVVISHFHYDHLSHQSVLEIKRHYPNAHFFVGLGPAEWFRKCGISKATELDWWQDAEPELTASTSSESEPSGGITARFSCLSSQHSSGRTLTVSSGNKSVWFAGDTGYRTVPELSPDVDDYGPDYMSLPRFPYFAQIGRLRGTFDLGLIPIGAYKPHFPWSQLHSNPHNAVEIFLDTKCQRAIGIHWGTWALTSEEIDEPAMILRGALKSRNIPETGVFDVCAVGESGEF
ncbi:beta-lactamase superfamily domain-containing protein [Aspergillus tetrazonus]